MNYFYIGKLIYLLKIHFKVVIEGLTDFSHLQRAIFKVDFHCHIAYVRTHLNFTHVSTLKVL